MSAPVKLKMAGPGTTREALAAGYELVAELFLDPRDRNGSRVPREPRHMAPLPDGVGRLLWSFLSRPEVWSSQEYLETLELAPPCPLYLGSYLFDEPLTCRGAGHSERNRYMVEARALYRHFGLETRGGELPDYVPLVVEFLRLSLDRDAPDADSLRRYFLETYVRPPLPAFRRALEEARTPYRLLAGVLETLVGLDLERLAAVSPWRPPEEPVPGQHDARTDHRAVRETGP